MVLSLAAVCRIPILCCEPGRILCNAIMLSTLSPSAIEFIKEFCWKIQRLLRLKRKLQAGRIAHQLQPISSFNEFRNRNWHQWNSWINPKGTLETVMFSASLFLVSAWHSWSAFPLRVYRRFSYQPLSTSYLASHFDAAESIGLSRHGEIPEESVDRRL